MNLVLDSFVREVTKTALEPRVRPGVLERSTRRLMRPEVSKPVDPPTPGTFGIKTSEHMTPEKWKQTAKDLPPAILVGGLGYGLGRTATEILGKNLARSGQRPAWLKHLPIGMALASGGTTFAASRLREALRRRREAADK